jgi:hypothetical protein
MLVRSQWSNPSHKQEPLGVLEGLGQTQSSEPLVGTLLLEIVPWPRRLCTCCSSLGRQGSGKVSGRVRGTCDNTPREGLTPSR